MFRIYVTYKPEKQRKQNSRGNMLKTMGGRHAVLKRNPKQMCWPFLIMCLNCHQIITRQKAGGLKSELSGQVTVFLQSRLKP